MTPRILTVLGLALTLLATSVRAQFEVGLKLDKSEFMAQEQATATITVINRSGADVVLGGPQGKPWMIFRITDSLDRSKAPVEAGSETPVVFPAGERITRKVRITETYALTELGNYGLTVSVYHPPSGKYYLSNRVRLSVIDEKPYKEPITFGVPEGYPGAGRTRQYVLMIHRDLDRSYLYFRLQDERSGQKLITYLLGPVSVVREPQFTLDRTNNFHVMFLAAPDQTIYCMITPDGVIKTVNYFRDADGSQPRLYLTKDNNVVASGGAKFDPAQERAAAAAAGSRVRSVSERPPGL